MIFNNLTAVILKLRLAVRYVLCTELSWMQLCSFKQVRQFRWHKNVDTLTWELFIAFYFLFIRDANRAASSSYINEM